MKLLFDQNISHRILKLLIPDFDDSTTVKKEKLIDVADKYIWEYAKKNNYIIVSKDSDFSDLSVLLGFPPKFIWIRRGNCATIEITKLLRKEFEQIKEFQSNKNAGIFILY